MLWLWRRRQLGGANCALLTTLMLFLVGITRAMQFPGHPTASESSLADPSAGNFCPVMKRRIRRDPTSSHIDFLKINCEDRQKKAYR